MQERALLIIDCGVELPAWLEFDSANLLSSDASRLLMGTGEYNRVDFSMNFKRGAPRAQCGAPAGAACTFRLETNPELYEGVRYGFLSLAAPMWRKLYPLLPLATRGLCCKT